MGVLRNGITARLLWLGLLPMVVILLATGTLLYDSLRQSLYSSLAHSLEEKADGIQANLRLSPEGLWQYEGRSTDAFGQIFSGWYWVLHAPRQTLYSRSLWDANLPGPSHPTHAGLLSQRDPRGRALLGIARPLALTDAAGQQHQAQLHVYTLASEVQSTLARIHSILWLALAFLLLFFIANTLVQVRVGLRPLQLLQQRLARMYDGGPTSETGRGAEEPPERLGSGYSPELDPLAQEMDALLERNARLLARGRTHAADLSHALKTPLARLSAQASAQDELPSALVLEQVRSINGLIERHLDRTRSASDAAPSLRARVPVRQTVHMLVQLMQHIHAERGVQWEVQQEILMAGPRSTTKGKWSPISTGDAAKPIPAEIYWRGEQSDLEEMLGNLLDNAGKWSRQRVRIRVDEYAAPQGIDTVARRAQRLVRIRISDDGPGIARENLQRGIQRGQRFDQHTPGSGLGLSITAEIAHSWGGTLELDTSIELGGLQATLTLPKA